MQLSTRHAPLVTVMALIFATPASATSNSDTAAAAQIDQITATSPSVWIDSGMDAQLRSADMSQVGGGAGTMFGAASYLSNVSQFQVQTAVLIRDFAASQIGGIANTSHLIQMEQLPSNLMSINDGLAMASFGELLRLDGAYAAGESSNTSGQSQSGQSNYALTAQFGVSNSAQQMQSGDRLLSLVTQYGKDNKAETVQTGTLNQAFVAQIGEKNSAVVNQYGSNALAIISQSGTGNVATIRQ